MTNNKTQIDKLDSVIINPKRSATHSVIWMHGLGADGYDFVDIVPQLNLPENLAMRFVFPHAPIRKVSYANNLPMRAWFDISPAVVDGFQDRDGILSSQTLIEQLLMRELSCGIPSRNIVLAGFSQGGAMALQCGLRYAESLGGILSLSGFLLLAENLPKEKHIANQNTPVLLIHGTQDALVPVIWAKNNYQYLADLGFNVKLQTYEMEHCVCDEEIRTISLWLQEVLGSSKQCHRSTNDVR